MSIVVFFFSLIFFFFFRFEKFSSRSKIIRERKLYLARFLATEMLTAKWNICGIPKVYVRFICMQTCSNKCNRYIIPNRKESKSTLYNFFFSSFSLALPVDEFPIWNSFQLFNFQTLSYEEKMVKIKGFETIFAVLYVREKKNSHENRKAINSDFVRRIRIDTLNFFFLKFTVTFSWRCLSIDGDFSKFRPLKIVL